MNHKALESDIEYLLKHFPREQVMQHYPRRIITPHGYLNPKYFSVLSFRFVYNNQLLGTQPTQQELQDVNDFEYFMPVLMEKQMPTYFVSQAFLQSVEQTSIPGDFMFSQLHFPMPGFLLVLPDQFTNHSVSLNFPFIMVATYQGLLYIRPFAILENGNFTCFSLTLKYKSSEESIKAFIDLNQSAQLIINSSEYTATIYLYALVLKLLLIISTQPRAFVDSLDDSPVRNRRVRHNGRVTDALWNPSFIGRGYSTQRSGCENGSGSGMRMHWRRGHLRNQRYGQARSQVKVVWIRPMLIHRELLVTENAPACVD